MPDSIHHDDLIRYMSLDETLDESIVEEINRHRDIAGDPIAKWCDEMERKAADPFNVNWLEIMTVEMSEDQTTLSLTPPKHPKQIIEDRARWDAAVDYARAFAHAMAWSLIAIWLLNGIQVLSDFYLVLWVGSVTGAYQVYCVSRDQSKYRTGSLLHNIAISSSVALLVFSLVYVLEWLLGWNSPLMGAAIVAALSAFLPSAWVLDNRDGWEEKKISILNLRGWKSQIITFFLVVTYFSYVSAMVGWAIDSFAGTRDLGLPATRLIVAYGIIMSWELSWEVELRGSFIDAIFAVFTTISVCGLFILTTISIHDSFIGSMIFGGILVGLSLPFITANAIQYGFCDNREKMLENKFATVRGVFVRVLIPIGISNILLFLFLGKSDLYEMLVAFVSTLILIVGMKKTWKMWGTSESASAQSKTILHSVANWYDRTTQLCIESMTFKTVA